jgi:hypothetical protein
MRSLFVFCFPIIASQSPFLGQPASPLFPEKIISGTLRRGLAHADHGVRMLRNRSTSCINPSLTVPTACTHAGAFGLDSHVSIE